MDWRGRAQSTNVEVRPPEAPGRMTVQDKSRKERPAENARATQGSGQRWNSSGIDSAVSDMADKLHPC